MAVSFFRFFGVNLETSVPAMQLPKAETPAMQVAPVASRMDEDAPMDFEGVVQDGLRKFKKEYEEMTCAYFAAVKRMGEHVGSNLNDSLSALLIGVPVSGARPHLDAVQSLWDGLKECVDENQRKMTKFFEAERSALTIAAASVLKPLASTVKPAGEPGKDERKTAEADEVPPAATRRRRARRNRKRRNAVPFVTKGPASDVRHGTIVGVNHGKKFAFIRTSHDTTDFYVGQQQYHHGMAIGDEVSFCELEPRGRRRRCPEAYHVDLLARAWTWYHRPYGARKRSTGL